MVSSLYTLLYLLLSILALGLLIFIHEMAHWAAAQSFRMRTRYVQVGVGPKLWSWYSRRFRTWFMLKLLPIVGFVRIPGVGFDPAWRAAKPWKATAVLLAGPIANLVLGVGMLEAMGKRIVPRMFFKRPVKAVRTYVPPAARAIAHSYTPSEFQGPVSMMKYSTKVGRRYGFREWLELVAAMSLGMGLFNLTPILPFDGGQIVWVFVRKWAGWKHEAWLENCAWKLSTAVACLFLALVAFDAVRAFWPEKPIAINPTYVNLEYTDSEYTDAH